VHADGDSRDGSIREDDYGGDRVEVLLNLSRDSTVVELVLLKITCLDEPRCIEDANLEKGLSRLTRITAPKLTTTPFLLVNS